MGQSAPQSTPSDPILRPRGSRPKLVTSETISSSAVPAFSSFPRSPSLQLSAMHHFHKTLIPVSDSRKPDLIQKNVSYAEKFVFWPYVQSVLKYRVMYRSNILNIRFQKTPRHERWLFLTWTCPKLKTASHRARGLDSCGQAWLKASTMLFSRSGVDAPECCPPYRVCHGWSIINLLQIVLT